MQDLLGALSQTPPVSYTVGVVTAVQVGTLTLSWQGGVAANVPHLLSYTPVVGDKVQLIGSEAVGILVLGKTTTTAPPATPVNRTAWLTPNRSMTWAEDPVTEVGAASEGLVTQGSDLIYTYSGSYVYPAPQVTLLPSEIIIKAELMIARVDPPGIIPMTAAPVLHELYSFDTDGQPRVLNPERDFIPTDMVSGDVIWHPIPVLWATNIVGGTSIGITFAPTSAQTALTFTQYAAYTTIVDPSTGAVGGKIRLTIENDVATDPGYNPNRRSGIGFILQSNTITSTGAGTRPNSASGIGLILVSYLITSSGTRANRQASGTGIISQTNEITSTYTRLSIGTGLISQSHEITSTSAITRIGTGLITQTHTFITSGIAKRAGTGVISQSHTLVNTDPFKRSGTSVIAVTSVVTSTGNKKALTGTGVISQTNTVTCVSSKFSTSGTGVISQTNTITSTGNQLQLASGTGAISQTSTITSTSTASKSGTGAISQTNATTSTGNAIVTVGPPVFQTVSVTAAPSTTSVVVTKPTGTVDGNLLLMIAYVDSDNTAMTAPAGWTLRGSLPDTIGDYCDMYVYTKVAASEGASYTWTVAGNSARAFACLRISGQSTTAPVNVGPTFSQATSTASQNAPSVTTTVANTLLIVAWGSQGGTATRSAATGMTERVDATSDTWTSFAIDTVALTVAGASGAKTTIASTALPYSSIAIAIAPAAVVINRIGMGAIEQTHTLTSTGNHENTGAISQTNTVTSTGNHLNTVIISQTNTVTSTGNQVVITPPSRITSAEISFTTLTATKTSTTFDVQAGDLVVITASVADPTITLGAFTWTGTGTVTAQTLATTVGVTDRTNVYVSTIAVTATATARTVSVTSTDALTPFGARISVWRGHAGVGAKAKGNAPSSAPSVTLTTTGTSSAIELITSDWTPVDGATRTWRTVNSSLITEARYVYVPPDYTVYQGYVANAGPIGAKVLGLTVPAGQIWTLGAIEILPA